MRELTQEERFELREAVERRRSCAHSSSTRKIVLRIASKYGYKVSWRGIEPTFQKSNRIWSYGEV